MTPLEFKNLRNSLVLTEKGASQYGGQPNAVISQAIIAKILNVKNDRTIRKWELGENDISGPAIVVMKAIFDVPEFRDYLGVEIVPT